MARQHERSLLPTFFASRLAKMQMWAKLESNTRACHLGLTLLVFGTPVIALIRAKLLVQYLFGKGHAKLAFTLLIDAHITNTATAAGLF